MTPKEKAEQLVKKYYKLIPMNTISFSKQCAIIAVDELIKHSFWKKQTKLWEEVKQEIEKV